MSKKDLRALDERLTLLEKVQTDGVDLLAREMKGLFHNDSVIGQAVEAHDTTIAAIKALLIEKGILTSEEIEAKGKEIDKMRAQAMEARKKEAELREVAEKAKKAALEEQGHPPEAFVFGG
jgi:2-oxoglutarate dehydrogenase complex dehydrogenase (E1) component-like enzyme